MVSYSTLVELRRGSRVGPAKRSEGDRCEHSGRGYIDCRSLQDGLDNACGRADTAHSNRRHITFREAEAEVRFGDVVIAVPGGSSVDSSERML